MAARADESKLDPLERRGRELFEHELASDRAGDAVLRSGYFTSLWNWIVIPQESAFLVRYINDENSVFADVLVDIFSSDLERVTVYDTPIALSSEQLEMWRARVAVVALARERGLLRCSAHYSLVVLPSLEPSRSWDVYLLPFSDDSRVVPIGGHYRFAVSSDPAVAPELHTFAESCADQKASSDSEPLIVRDTTAKTPTEIHVFLNLRYGFPLDIIVNGEKNGLWFVRNGEMTLSNGASANAPSNARADH